MIKKMEETALDYSLMDSSYDDKQKVSNSSIRNNDRISIRKSVLLVIVISVSVVFIGSEVIVFLLSSRNNDCNFVIPKEAAVLPKQGTVSKSSSGNTLPYTSQDITTTLAKVATDELSTEEAKNDWTHKGKDTSTTTKQTTDWLATQTYAREKTTTQNPGCPDNWMKYGSSCYYFSNISVAWLAAMVRCQKLGGNLAEINTAEEDEFLREQAKQIPMKECYQTTAREYRGLRNTTFDGHACQRWDSQSPHRHTRNNIRNFPEYSLADAANYCRDPDQEMLPWCYTTDPKIRWQYCDIYKCPGGNFWIGMVVLELEWKWMKGQTKLDVGYTNWGKQEPSGGNCGSLLGSLDFSWNAQDCSLPAMYICEM